MTLFRKVSKREHQRLAEAVDDLAETISSLRKKAIADRARITSLERRCARLENLLRDNGEDDEAEDEVDNGQVNDVEEKRLRLGRGE
jgi:hypothetical protein